MMKRITFYMLLIQASCFTAACKKENLVSFPLERSFEDPSTLLSQYGQKLREPENGWEFSLQGKDHGFFVGFLHFGENHSAKFTADHNEVTAAGLTDVGYRVSLKGANTALRFEAGSAFAEMASLFIGLDTVFTFKTINETTIFLTGDQYGSKLILTKASAGKAQAYQNGGIVTTMENLERITKLPLYFKRLTMNGSNYDIHINPTFKTMLIHYGGNNNFKIHETQYGHTATGIYLQKPLIDGINTIGYIDALTVNPQNNQMTASVNNIAVSLINTTAPSTYDEGAATRFFNNPTRQLSSYNGENYVIEKFSVSAKGFSIAGVPDAYALNSIANYQYITFFHQFNGQNYGGIRFFIANQISAYGPALAPQFSETGGFVRFIVIGHFGSTPDEVKEIMTSTTNAFTEETGFYVIKSGAACYDLVTVSDGKKWIRFE